MEQYDLLIIGGSAAATSAGIYAARRNLNFKIIAKDFGGEVLTSGEIGNWPGDTSINGFALTQRFREHLESYGVKVDEGVEVAEIKKQPDGPFCVSVKKDGVTMAADKIEDNGNGAPTCDYFAKAVIMATGVHPRQLGVPGEKEFRGKGVTYCTVCDGPLFSGKTVAVIGGGNSALESILMLSEICPKVYVVNLTENFTGEPILIEKVKAKKNVEIIHNAQTAEIIGNDFVNGLKYYKDKAGEVRGLKIEGIFVHIGMVPNSKIAPEAVEKDQLGQIKVNTRCETNVPGFFAAGDVTNVPFKQIAIAAGQGTTALLSAVTYLNKLKV